MKWRESNPFKASRSVSAQGLAMRATYLLRDIFLLETFVLEIDWPAAKCYVTSNPVIVAKGSLFG
jgi:hypothetical protein